MIDQVKLAIIAIVVVMPLTSFAVYAGDSSQNTVQEDVNLKPFVMSSFYPLYEFAKKVGQDKVDVVLLVPMGVEPHDWEPTIQDVQRMQKADLVVINGIGFENWVDHLDEMNFQGTIVDTSKGIDVREIDITEDLEHEEPEHEGHTSLSDDPHIWLNPVLAKTQVQNIADEFSNLDPQNKKFYQQNAKSYKNELDTLDKKIRYELSDCNRDFVAFHKAFSYFADEYNLNQHTIISSNEPHAEPTAKTLENVINIAREFNVKVIFTEETADPRTSEVIANEIGGKVLVLSPIEIGDDDVDYISKMTDNLNNLKEALC